MQIINTITSKELEITAPADTSKLTQHFVSNSLRAQTIKFLLLLLLLVVVVVVVMITITTIYILLILCLHGFLVFNNTQKSLTKHTKKNENLLTLS